jgi:hypothetical protein
MGNPRVFSRWYNFTVAILLPHITVLSFLISQLSWATVRATVSVYPTFLLAFLKNGGEGGIGTLLAATPLQHLNYYNDNGSIA